MIDPNLLRHHPQQAADLLATRGYELDVASFTALDNQRKQLQIATDSLRAERNSSAKKIGAAKSKGEDIEPYKQAVSELGDKLKKSEDQLKQVQAQYDELVWGMPNLPEDSVPQGKTEADNKLIREWGKIKSFSFKPQDHVALGENIKGLDFGAASQLSGSRFVVIKNQLARLNRALIQFMLDTHTLEHGYTEIMVPFLVKPQAMYGTGQLPKFAEDQFMTQGEHELALIPTAEVPVTNLVSKKILEPKDFPLRYVCYSHCFRKEAGSYGKDTRGMIRQHQFEKVELVHIVQPKDSAQVLEELTQHAEIILQKLDLPYRVMELCTADLGFAAQKTYDLEVWLPSQNCYREISSCSNTGAFQARRMHARFRNQTTGKPELVHTLNGSGLAVGRTLVAIMENYQDEQGRIHIPEALHAYCGDLRVIG